MTRDDVSGPCVHGKWGRVTQTLLLLALLLSGLNASANLYYDYDYINTVLSSSTRDKWGTFNIAVQGYNPNAESIDWAGFAFTFIDSDNREDTVRISLGHEAISYEHIEYGFNIFGGLLEGDALIDLSTDGIISYHVRWISGDPFRLMSATLLAETTANSLPASPVPDGGSTLALLGFALLAIGVARTRLASNRRT